MGAARADAAVRPVGELRGQAGLELVEALERQHQLLAAQAAARCLQSLGKQLDRRIGRDLGGRVLPRQTVAPAKFVKLLRARLAVVRRSRRIGEKDPAVQRWRQVEHGLARQHPRRQHVRRPAAVRACGDERFKRGAVAEKKQGIDVLALELGCHRRRIRASLRVLPQQRQRPLACLRLGLQRLRDGADLLVAGINDADPCTARHELGRRVVRQRLRLRAQAAVEVEREPVQGVRTGWKRCEWPNQRDAPLFDEAIELALQAEGHRRDQSEHLAALDQRLAAREHQLAGRRAHGLQLEAPTVDPPLGIDVGKVGQDDLLDRGAERSVASPFRQERSQRDGRFAEAGVQLLLEPFEVSNQVCHVLGVHPEARHADVKTRIAGVHARADRAGEALFRVGRPRAARRGDRAVGLRQLAPGDVRGHHAAFRAPESVRAVTAGARHGARRHRHRGLADVGGDVAPAGTLPGQEDRLAAGLLLGQARALRVGGGPGKGDTQQHRPSGGRPRNVSLGARPHGGRC